MAARPMPEQTLGDPRRFNVKAWLLWTVGFVSFPIAGVAAVAAVGRINDAVAALIGGLIAGAVFGAFWAITFMALSGVLLDRLRAATPAAQHVPPTASA
jgi:uncharacterized membrane protein YkvI